MGFGLSGAAIGGYLGIKFGLVGGGFLGAVIGASIGILIGVTVESIQDVWSIHHDKELTDKFVELFILVSERIIGLGIIILYISF